MRNLKLVSLMILVIFVSVNAMAQEGYEFTDNATTENTPVKNQYRAGTCWSYSTIGFLEAELLREGKGEFDLSEAYVYRICYLEKAIKYVRMHGNTNFGGGGAVNDAIDVIKNYGMVTEEAYPGLNYGTDMPVHGEIDAILKSYVDAVIENKNKELTTAWIAGYNGILDAYFGELPETFEYNGAQITPRDFADNVLEFDFDDYIYVTSYTHHPFYSEFAIEVPDNWTWSNFHNLPMNELMEIFNGSIEAGYTVAWASDISEKGFSSRKGVAIVPETNVEELDGMEMGKWEEMSNTDKNKFLYSFEKPVQEKVITQEDRQKAYDNYQTTDDHGMVLTGLATDQEGNSYFKVKNSWGDYNSYGGYFYASQAFVSYKTMSAIVHKDAIPKAIQKKMGL